MAKYIYPAVFTPEKDAGFFIEFPDLSGCYTQGENLQDGLEMAEDALSLMLIYLEDKQETIPSPSSIEGLHVPDGAFSTYISSDTTVYRRVIKKDAVKKTLTIPAWLNERAVAAGINFSQALQEALKERLGIV